MHRFGCRKLVAYSLAVVAGIAAVTIGTGVDAGTMNILYAFCSQSNCSDGGGTQLSGGLVMDGTGNLYGVTQRGGANGYGVAYELTPGESGQYSYQVLYNFCSLSGCTDGSQPNGALVIDTSGNLYGVTGSPDGGEVFELSKSSGNWALTVLHAFCQDCADASDPEAGLTYLGAASGLPYDGTSPLFGTAFGNGAYSEGAVFELQPGTGGWSENVIYSFCPQLGCPDGARPAAPLIEDDSGSLFGVTPEGGKRNGVIFKLSSAGGSWSESVLKPFCRIKNCGKGTVPTGVTLSSAGDLIGFTHEGGYRPRGERVTCAPIGCGVVFSLGDTKPKYSVTYDFCKTGYRCQDGGGPTGAPVLDSSGDIFGTTTTVGQERKYGALFEINGSTLQESYEFGIKKNPAGAGPVGTVLRDSSGRLYGITSYAGPYGYGVVYQFVP